MPFTRKVKFPLTNHVDVTGIAHANLLESEYSRVGLAPQAGSILARNWGQNDQNDYIAKGTAVGQIYHDKTNKVLVVKDGAHNAALWDIGADLRAVYARVKVTDQSMYFGLTIRSIPSTQDNGWQAIFNNVGKFTIHKGLVGEIVSTTASYVLNTWYRFYLSVNGNTITFKIYDDNNILIETLSFADGAFNANTYAGVFNYYNATGACSWLMVGTNTEDLIKNYFPTTSPSPATVWTALQAGDVVDMSTAKIWMYKDGVVQAAGNTDVTLKYAANNGSDSTAKTLTQLRAEPDVTVTNETNSFKIYGLYASNGLYKSESETWVELNVISADGGGKYDKFAKYGYRRIGA